jgi:hypothetical protein
MDETLLTILLAILGQYALLIAVMVQNGAMKEAIDGLKEWKTQAAETLHTLEIEHAENHGRPARHD